MNRNVKNRLAMYKNVQIVINANAASWNGLPAFVSAFDTYSGKLALLEDYGLEQSLIVKGVSSAKNAQRTATIEKAIQVAGAVRAYATSINDAVLKAKSKIRKSDLDYSSRVNCVLIIDGILDNANTNAEALLPFGISQADIATLQELRDALYASFSAPRQAILGRKLLTSDIKALVNEIEGLLKDSLDQLAQVIKLSDQSFFKKYTNAREVLDYGSHHESEVSESPPEPDDDPGEEPGV